MDVIKMRITGKIGQSDLGYVRPYLLCEEPVIHAPIRMVVDTGASMTSISERDAIRLGIDYSTLYCPEDQAVYGIGGVCRCYLTGEAILMFKISKNSWHSERLPCVAVLKTETESEEEREIALKIPSLLGKDVLQRYSTRFTEKRVYLEK